MKLSLSYCRVPVRLNQYLLLTAFCVVSNLLFITPSAVPSGELCVPISEIKGDLRTKIPWTAAIYSKPDPNSSFRFLVTGTIVGPSTVLALFGASSNNASENGKQEIFAADHLLIGSGLLSTNLKTADKFAQLREVKSVLPYTSSGPDSSSSSYEYEYFLIFLKTPFDLTTPYVRSICLGNPFISKDISPFGWNLILGGFSIPRGSDQGLQLKSQLLSPESEENCRSSFKSHYNLKSLNTDLICGKVYQGKDAARSKNNLQCVLLGSPGFIYVENIGTLAGIAVLIPGQKNNGGECGDSTMYFLSAIGTHLEWIKNNLL